MIKKHRRHPPWGATKKQAEQYQRERDIKNRLFALQQSLASERSSRTPSDLRDSLAVTQELVALFYVEDRKALDPWPNDPVFTAGFRGDPPPDAERYRWEAGALAAHLIEIGGQR